MGAEICTREAGRRVEVEGARGASIPCTMVASGSTNVACESNVGSEEDESGIFLSGEGSELELSPLAGTPMTPWFNAFPRPGGSNRESLFFIFAWLGRSLNRRTALQGTKSH